MAYGDGWFPEDEDQEGSPSERVRGGLLAETMAPPDAVPSDRSDSDNSRSLPLSANGLRSGLLASNDKDSNLLPAASGTQSNADRGTHFDIDPVLRGTYRAMKEKSPTFKAWAETLENSKDALHALRQGNLEGNEPAGADCDMWGNGCIITIDPDRISKTDYITKNGSKAPMTVERAIAHEVRHALYSEQSHVPFKRLSLLPHSSYIKDENKVMREFDPSSPDRDPDDDSLPQRR